MVRATLLFLLLIVAVGFALAPPAADQPTLIKTTGLIDTRTGSILNNQAILINGAKIAEVGPVSVVSQHAAETVRVVDLRGLTV